MCGLFHKRDFGASSEQTAGIEEINHAVAQMDVSTQQNAALVEEVATAAQSLEVQAKTLQEAVSLFRVGGVGVPAGTAASQSGSLVAA
ncbi:hypothetical protein CJO75_16015 [Ralstonia solanacearum]|nr:hypothetical protein CJO75_16015 [Ralstonia solanacearum]AXW16129.1 hypothetical protein CJO84_16320 [Ralstonia solanacearum]AXW39738.1 hypothetical protein CJO89_16690 [Ralstonia solanacearum]AXW72511.1 hypothetical protein CJO96_16045 [Ralstonia solanacearum]